jgi:hypothetical protein
MDVYKVKVVAVDKSGLSKTDAKKGWTCDMKIWGKRGMMPSTMIALSNAVRLLEREPEITGLYAKKITLTLRLVRSVRKPPRKGVSS